jgi:hypothetical protein
VLASRDGIDPTEAAQTLDPIEQEILALLLRHPEQRAALAGAVVAGAVPRAAGAPGSPGATSPGGLTPETLLTTPARELWRALLAADVDARAADPTAPGAALGPFLAGLDPELAAIASGLVLRAGPSLTDDRVARAVDQCLIRLQLRRVGEELDFLRADLAEPPDRRETRGAGETLVERIRSLERERADLDRRAAASTVLTRTPTNSNTSKTSKTPVGGPA